jgi:hypothetical protein
VNDGVRHWLAHDPRVRAVLRRREARDRRQTVVSLLVASALLSFFVVPLVLGMGCSSGGWSTVDRRHVVVTSTDLPFAVRGSAVEHGIPLDGGCGAPYDVEVIGGLLPPGISALGGSSVRLEGVVLQEGEYAFRLRIHAHGCDVLATTEANFHWRIEAQPSSP